MKYLFETENDNCIFFIFAIQSNCHITSVVNLEFVSISQENFADTYCLSLLITHYQNIATITLHPVTSFISLR